MPLSCCLQHKHAEGSAFAYNTNMLRGPWQAGDAGRLSVVRPVAWQQLGLGIQLQWLLEQQPPQVWALPLCLLVVQVGQGPL